MRIDNFIWLQAIVEKLAVKHQISPEEVEEVFLNEPRYRYVESGYRTGEVYMQHWAGPIPAGM